MSWPIDYILKSLDKVCRDHPQPYELFQDINWVHVEKYYPCPRWSALSSTTLLPSHQHKLVRVWCYTLSSLLSSNCSPLPWNINISYVINVVRISPPLKNSWYGDTSHHHHSFLGPRVDSNRGTNKWAVLFGFCPSRNPLALKLMVDRSFLDNRLLNHHSNVGRATQPIFRVHLSTNV